MQPRTKQERYEAAVARQSVISHELDKFAEGQRINSIATNVTDFSDEMESISAADADDIAAILCDDNCVTHFSVSLYMGSISVAAVEALARALASGATKEGLNYHFASMNMSGAKCAALASALASGKLPKNFSLHLKWCDLQDADIVGLADAIKLGTLPEGMKLELDNYDDNDPRFPVRGNHVQDATWKLLFTAIAEGHAKARANGRTYNNFSLLLPSSVSSELIPFFIDELTTGKYPAEFSLDFSGNKFSREDIEKFANPEKLRLYPPKLTLEFAGHRTEATIAFEHALQISGRTDVAYNIGGVLGHSGLEAIVKRITSGTCKPGTKFDFSHAGFDDHGAVILAKALIDPACPDNLSLFIGLSNLTGAGYQAFIDACQQGGAKNLKLNFSFNGYFTNANIESLIVAMKSETFMRGLYLYFAFNIGYQDEKRNALKQALIDTVLSDQCPQGLQLEFFVSMRAKEYAPIAERMMKQTALCGLEFGGVVCDAGESEILSKNIAIISLCCQRNKLMYDHPELTSQIKSIAMEYGMYQPGASALPQLQVTSLFKSHDMKLPADVIAWQRGLEEFKNKYQANVFVQNSM